MTLQQLTSAIYNNIVSGLKGTNANVPVTHEHIEDSIIAERLLLIKEYMVKGLVPRRDLLVSIPCITLNCYPIEKCPVTGFCSSVAAGTNYLHFEIPQVIHDFAEEAIEYIGSKDRMNPFKVYIDMSFAYNKYRTRRSTRPYVWIDVTPNKNNKYDGYIFNAPLLKEITVVIIPKDVRHLYEYPCCNLDEIDNFSFFSSDIEKRLSEKFIRYYRQMTMPITPGDLQVKP